MSDPRLYQWMMEVKEDLSGLKAMLTAHLEEHQRQRHNGTKELAVAVGGASTGTGVVVLGILKLLGVV